MIFMLTGSNSVESTPRNFQSFFGIFPNFSRNQNNANARNEKLFFSELSRIWRFTHFENRDIESTTWDCKSLVGDGTFECRHCRLTGTSSGGCCAAAEGAENVPSAAVIPSESTPTARRGRSTPTPGLCPHPWPEGRGENPHRAQGGRRPSRPRNLNSILAKSQPLRVGMG